MTALTREPLNTRIPFARLLDKLGHDPAKSRISICFRPVGGEFATSIVSAGGAPLKIARVQKGADVWFGLNAVSKPVQEFAGRGLADDVIRWAALAADLDVKPKGLPSMDAARAVIDDVSGMLGQHPLAVILSGHGLQPIWALDPEDMATSWPDSRDSRWPDAVALNRRFGRLVRLAATRRGGDIDSVFDLSRVLRVPRTCNHKNPGAVVETDIEWLDGAPLTVAHLSEALDAYGVAEFPEDRNVPGEAVTAHGDWSWATDPCPYLTSVVRGWSSDTPGARHPWLVSQAVRLAAAHRLGCITEADHNAATAVLIERFHVLLGTQEPVRKAAVGEESAALQWGVHRVEAMADARAHQEISGPHAHHDGAGTAAKELLAASGIGGDLTASLDPVTPATGSPAAAGAETDDDTMPISWAPVDLRPFLDGTHTHDMPKLLPRTDGVCLLYPGRVHSMHGESESGKSWIAIGEAARLLITGGRAWMIDFESDAATTVNRLLLLGVPAAAVAASFVYTRPECNPRAVATELEAWHSLLRQRFDLVIIDGVTEALSVFSVKSLDNDEYTSWHRAIPRRIANWTGAAVVVVDHVVKATDSRGRFAIGAQAKTAVLDGASYVVEVLKPLGVGMVGRISLRVAKDRPGQVRPHSGAWRKADRTQEAAQVIVDSSVPGIVQMTVEPPNTEIDVTAGETAESVFRPTVLMEGVSRAVEESVVPMSRNAVVRAVPGRARYVREATQVLVDEGWLAEDGEPIKGHPSLRSVRPFRDGMHVPEKGTRLTVVEGSSTTASASPTRGGDAGRGSDRGEMRVLGRGGTRSGRGSDMALMGGRATPIEKSRNHIVVIDGDADSSDNAKEGP